MTSADEGQMTRTLTSAGIVNFSKIKVLLSKNLSLVGGGNKTSKRQELPENQKVDEAKIVPDKSISINSSYEHDNSNINI